VDNSSLDGADLLLEETTNPIWRCLWGGLTPLSQVNEERHFTFTERFERALCADFATDLTDSASAIGSSRTEWVKLHRYDLPLPNTYQSVVTHSYRFAQIIGNESLSFW
jgi:hypothetical protein